MYYKRRKQRKINNCKKESILGSAPVENRYVKNKGLDQWPFYGNQFQGKLQASLSSFFMSPDTK